MKISTKIAILFAAIWFGGKMLFLQIQWFQEPETFPYQVFWNILCLLMAMTIGSYIEKRKEDRSESSALGDIKSILSGGLIYTIITAALIFTYYSKIDPDFNKHQIEVAEGKIQEMIDDPKQLKELRHSRTEFASLSKKELFDKLAQNPRSMFKAKSTFVISLLGMLLLSVMNAIVLTVVYRRLIFKA